jgi:hypothetical protein
MRFPSMVLLVLLALSTGCAGSLPRVLCAEQGGPPWHELKSPHFRVRSHLELKDSKRIVRELETQRRILRRFWDDAFDPPGETEVLLVRDRSTLDEFSGGGGEPNFTQFTEWGPWLVLSGNSGASYPLDKGAPPDAPPIIRHELAHLLSRYLLLRQPRWLAEGLATYLETAAIQERSGEVIFGGTYEDTYETLGRNLLRDPELLWGWDDLPLHAASRAYRVTAWGWVHFLLNEHPKRFADFQARLARAEEPRYAWRGDAVAGARHAGRGLSPGAAPGLRAPARALPAGVPCFPTDHPRTLKRSPPCLSPRPRGAAPHRDPELRIEAQRERHVLHRPEEHHEGRGHSRALRQGLQPGEGVAEVGQLLGEAPEQGPHQHAVEGAPERQPAHGRSRWGAVDEEPDGGAADASHDEVHHRIAEAQQQIGPEADGAGAGQVEEAEPLPA